jgi:hypothetical protein
MGASNILPGKANSIANGVSGDDRHEYACHAPVFVGYGDAPANSISGERLQPPTARPRRATSRTMEQARDHGLTMPEALDLSPDELAAWAGVPPESPPDQS